MRAVLLGPPGVGKGTVASMLSSRHKIPHISTGDIFKQAIRRGTGLGLKVKSIVESGNLVPDEVANEVVRERLSEPDAKKGFFLDGYPRTVEQARAMEKFSRPDIVLNLFADGKTIVERLSGRRVCPKCGSIFHLKNNPPKRKDACDKCGKALIRRKDDGESVILNRLKVYEKQTAPLIDYYRGKGILAGIDANTNMDKIEKVLSQCDKALSTVK